MSFGVDLRLVVIDTLAAFFGLQDENDNAEVAGLMAALARIGRESDLLIMPVAHHGKGDAGVRGASAFGAGADGLISVLADIEQNTGKVSNRSVALAKIRGGAPGPLGSFEIHSHVLGFDEDGDPVTAGYVEFDTNDKRAPIAQARSKIHPSFFEAFDAVFQETGQRNRCTNGAPCCVSLLIPIRAGSRPTAATNTSPVFPRCYPRPAPDALPGAFGTLLCHSIPTVRISRPVQRKARSDQPIGHVNAIYQASRHDPTIAIPIN